MSRRISRRVWITGVVLATMSIFVVGVIWWGLAASNNPQYQQEISMPSLAGIDDYFVNVWLEPSPAQVGTNQMTAQVTSTIGTPTTIDGMIFHLSGPESSAETSVPATLENDTGKPSQSFSAPIRFDAAGQWTITVEIHNGDLTRTASFNVVVGAP